MKNQTNDTPESMQIAIRNLPGFADISEEAVRKLEKKSSLLRFRIGQPLADSETLPADVYWVIQGECRIFGNDQKELTTLGRIGPGSSVGVASLLSARPCEKITASTPVVALAVSDEQIIELYQAEASFRAWCNQTVWPAEIIALLEKTSEKKAKIELTLQEKLQKAMQGSKLLTSPEEASSSKNEE